MSGQPSWSAADVRRHAQAPHIHQHEAFVKRISANAAKLLQFILTTLVIGCSTPAEPQTVCGHLELVANETDRPDSQTRPLVRAHCEEHMARMRTEAPDKYEVAADCIMAAPTSLGGQVELYRLLADQGGSHDERTRRRLNATRGILVSGASDGRIRAAASQGINEYLFGVGDAPRQPGSATAHGVREAVAFRLRTEGFAESQIQQATSSFAFMNNAAEDARRTFRGSDQEIYNAMISQMQRADAQFTECLSLTTRYINTGDYL